MAVTMEQVRRVAEARKELNAALAELLGKDEAVLFVRVPSADAVREVARAAGVPAMEGDNAIGLFEVDAEAFGVEFFFIDTTLGGF